MTLWPNRSLPRSGFRAVIAFTGVMLCIPLIPILGTPVGWALLPFLIATVLLLWFFFERNYKDGRKLREELRLWPNLITLDRYDPDGRTRHWEANPYWVRTELYKDGKVANYLTLKGGGREVELGAFLSPDERIALRDDVERALGQARMAERE